MQPNLLCLLSVLLGSSPPAAAPADTAFLAQYAATRGFSLGRPTGIQLTPAGDAVLFLRSGPRSFVQNLYVFNPGTGSEQKLLDVDTVLGGEKEALSPQEKARRERMRVTARGITSFSMSEDGRTLLVPLSGRLFLVDRVSLAVRELSSDAGYPIDPRLSPDATRLACVRGGDLYVTDIATGEERRLTTGGGETLSHGLAEFVAQEEMDRFRGFWWSPDGSTLAYQETDTEGLEVFHIADAEDPAKEPARWPYPRPGKKNAQVRLGLVPAVGGETRWIDWDHEAYPYLAAVTWEGKAPLTLLVQNRAQTVERLLAVEATTGAATLLLEETDPAWINLVPGFPKWFERGDGFLWMTERGGAWQLERRDRNGKLARTLTGADFGLQGLADLDEGSGVVTVVAGPDPREKHLWRVSLDGRRRPRRLSEEPGVHGALFARGHGVYVHTSNSGDGELRWRVRRASGEILGELRSVAETPPNLPRLEYVSVGEDPVLYARLTRPRDFDPSHRYPVLLDVYGGPHVQNVLRTPMSYLLTQYFADQGFIVVALDGRGTPGRGRVWERAIKGNLILVPLRDQVEGLLALGRRFPELDLSRVGVYGWSFGGYFAAQAVLQRPDVFQAAVIGAPVCDWHDYDTHYTERYLGLPEENPEGYAASSVLTYAAGLRRPVQILHGTADDNVYFMHSLKLTEALFRAGRPFEFVPLPGFTHMVPDPLVTSRLQSRIAEFFVRHL